jgi:hypothetical protein
MLQKNPNYNRNFIMMDEKKNEKKIEKWIQAQRRGEQAGELARGEQRRRGVRLK